MDARFRHDRRFIRELRKAVGEAEAQEVAELNDRGNRYREMGDFDRALRDFDKAISMAPRVGELYSNRGNAHVGKGHYERAIADYDEAIRLRPEVGEYYTNRGGREARQRGHRGGAGGL